MHRIELSDQALARLAHYGFEPDPHAQPGMLVFHRHMAGAPYETLLFIRHRDGTFQVQWSATASWSPTDDINDWINLTAAIFTHDEWYL